MSSSETGERGDRRAVGGRAPTVQARARVAAVASVLVACGAHAGATSREAEPVATAGAVARVRVRGAPAHGDIVWIAGQGVVASAPLAADGTCVVPAAGASATTVLVRIAAPVLGVVEVAAGPAIDLDVGAAQLATIRGAIAVPAGLAFDWVELHLTPRLATLAPRLVLAEGTGTSIRGAFATRRLTTPSFSAEVVAGTWEVRVDREVDAPLGASEIVLETASVAAAGLVAPIENHGGWQLPIAGASTLTVTLRQRVE